MKTTAKHALIYICCHSLESATSYTFFAFHNRCFTRSTILHSESLKGFVKATNSAWKPCTSNFVKLENTFKQFGVRSLDMFIMQLIKDFYYAVSLFLLILSCNFTSCFTFLMNIPHSMFVMHKNLLADGSCDSECISSLLLKYQIVTFFLFWNFDP